MEQFIKLNRPRISRKYTLLFLVALPIFSFAQKTENVVLITLDGLRWQEVFSGADSSLLFNEKYTETIEKTAKKFWNDDPLERRSLLMPFLWSEVKTKGQIHGNRALGSKVDVKNIYGFSYPGYNEILTGYPDKEVDSNDEKYNKNTTFLEFLNQKPAFNNKVAAFCTWQVFPYIINDKRSGVPVNAGLQSANSTGTKQESLLNEILETVPSLASKRFDFLTYYLAKDYMTAKKPKVMYIAFDETDEFAHEGKYREYLTAANTIDSFIEDLWAYCQSEEQYRNKTTFIIATDHGRGDAIKDQWKSHGQKVKDGYSIWFAAMGPDTPALGEIKSSTQLYQNQIASSIVKLLGEKFENGKPVGKPMDVLFIK
ncbi:Type I phosphodiesterase / nucleotide pyrophosphatase [Spirosomataceae bacterium TFI 002]|nr:Type I phosphodiesterase / nucleotide pyrophosphatase [Spirosomataceae bacterium TFI 002]